MRHAVPLVLWLLAACDEQPVSRADLATLPERARKGDKSAFEHLLELRKTGGPDAVPVLIRVLEDHRGSTRIFRFAAEQALFHIGGAEAEAALREDCAADDYPWWPAIDYTFHWDMDPGERDRFLARHVVRSSNTKLKTRLTADRAAAKPGEDVTLTLAVTNTTKGPVAILVTDGQPSTDLILRGAEGRFARVRPVRGGLGARQEVSWRTLKPDESAEYRFVRAFHPCAHAKGRYYSHGVVRELNVETEGGGGGRFDVIAVVTGAIARIAGDPPAAPWIGRVVAEPLALSID